jgi:hypothetical protein
VHTPALTLLSSCTNSGGSSNKLIIFTILRSVQVYMKISTPYTSLRSAMPHPPRPLPPILLCALLAPFLVCSQQSSPLSFSNFDSNFVGIAGSLYVISWTGGNDTTRVVLSLSTPLNCGDNTSTIAGAMTRDPPSSTSQDRILMQFLGFRGPHWKHFRLDYRFVPTLLY